MRKYLPKRFELINGILLGLIPLIIAAPILFFRLVPIIKRIAPSPQKIFDNSPNIEHKQDPTIDVLLMGHGGREHSGGGLADAIIVARINHEAKSAALIAIPRDTWVQLPIRSDISESHKINMSFAIGNDDAGYPLKEPAFVGYHGGGNMAKHAINKATSIFPDYYVSIDFNSFQKAIDLLGGINVNVPVSFKDEFYPVKGLENESCGKSGEEIANLTATSSGFILESQFKCRYETLNFNKGKMQMDGSTALKFIRSRHSPEHGSDFARGQRQQALLSAFAQKLISINALKNIDKLYEQYKNFVRTDISLGDAYIIAEFINKPENYKIKNINITDKNYLQSAVSTDGQYTLIPKAGEGNFSEIHNFIKQQLGD